MTMQIRYTFVPSVTLTSHLLRAKKKKTRLAVKSRAYVIHTRKDNDSRGYAARGSVLNKYMLSLKNSLKIIIKKHTSAFI